MKSLGMMGLLAAGALFVACAGGDSSVQSNPFGTPSTPVNPTGNDAGTSGGETDTTSDDAGEAGAQGTDESGGGEAEPLCGDGVRQDSESCDGMDIGKSTCADFGFTEGTLVCDAQCNLLTEACRACGDGMLAPSELCDGELLGGETCQSQGFGGGTLQCDTECAGFNTEACTPLPTCGDGVRNGGEACDGADLGNATCESVGFDVGSLACTASCTHDTSACEFLSCGQQGQFCLFDENDPQGTCCPAGVGGNLLGICVLAICQ